MTNLIIPSVILSAVSLMYKIFNYSEDEYGMRLNFIEGLKNWKGKYYWKVEYKIRRGQIILPSDMQRIYNKLIIELGSFDVLDISFNFVDRIYVFVEPSLSTKDRRTADIVAKETFKAEKSQNKKDRDLRRAAKFQTLVRDAQKQAIDCGADKSLITSIPNIQTKYKVCKTFLSKETVTTKYLGLDFIKFKKAETIVPAVVKKQESKPVQDVKPECNFKSPVAKLTSMSCDQDGLYASGRLTDTKIFELVRGYLGYLKQCSVGIVNSNGETKLSSEFKLKSEGLPTGEKLLDLYNKTMINRGFTKEDICEDLEGIRSFEQTSRTIRLQTAREKMSQWMKPTGLKGGCTTYLPPLHYEYFDTKTEYQKASGTLKGECILTVSDESGIINRFN